MLQLLLLLLNEEIIAKTSFLILLSQRSISLVIRLKNILTSKMISEIDHPLCNNTRILAVFHRLF